MRFEMRWLVTLEQTEKILQYRYETEITDYSTQNPRTGGFLKRPGWTEWQTVNEVINAEIR